MAHTFTACTPKIYGTASGCCSVNSDYNISLIAKASVGNVSLANTTISTCSGQFLKTCTNYNILTGNTKQTFKIDAGVISYTFDPAKYVTCTTKNLTDRIITTCTDGTKTTMFLPTNDISGKLDIVDKLLNNAQSLVNEVQQYPALSVDPHLHGHERTLGSGVSSGDVNTIPTVASKLSFNIPHIGIVPYETIINPNTSGEANKTTIKCRNCGNIWHKSYLLNKKLYWCQFCSTGRVFSPHTVHDFAPYKDMDELKKMQEEIIEQHRNIYTNNKGFWLN